MTRLGFNGATYLHNTWNFLEGWDIGSGLVKGAVFGFLIAVVGCYYGMNSGRGAQGVGGRPTAVVAASILILASNYVLTEFFFAS